MKVKQQEVVATNVYKKCYYWLMSVEDTASQSSVVFETRYTA